MDEETKAWISKTDPERRRARRGVQISIWNGAAQTVILAAILAVLILK